MQTEISDAFCRIFEKLNEFERRINNIIIPGKVIKLSENGKKVKVEHGSCETPYVKWLAICAGEIIEYRAPSINESCLLLNLTGGDDSTACVALFGLDSNEYTLPDCKLSEHKRIYPNGTEVTHDHKTNELTIIMSSNGAATIKAPKKITLDTELLYLTGKMHANNNIHSDKHVSDSKRSMQHDRDIYNEHDHGGVKSGTAKTSTPADKQ